ncbi:GGDEF domain-containing protein [Thiomicrorhabdus sp. Milos-T2]|uniref:GGDEF domain-containing protein n=1 Tax=Thiomicrorhabdus sp. Milos-T2 TaxID=90814 RepID=UPI000493DF75|nr:GGDEF domain-containing protein [Thiomicrorhabdus sp. Milos-T2]
MFKPDVPYFDYEPYIHAKNGAYHFDMMIPAFMQGQKLVLFMSFKAPILSQILKEHIISEHPVFLVRKDIPDLIEVTSSAVREELKRPIKLNAGEISRIGATSFVDYTKWKVVVIENAKVMNNFKHERQLDMAIIFLVLFVFWAAVTWLGLHYENRRGTLLSKLSHQSLHDALTGLVNRRKLNQELSFAIQEAHDFKCFSVILYMDLNGFKEVNDSYGHDVGDALLIEFAKRLKQLTRHHDVVARLGGDEFVVLLKNLGSSPEEIQGAIEDALKRFEVKLNANYDLAGINQSLKCIPSIGSVVLDNHIQSVDEILKRADFKMYEQKKAFKI